MKFYFERVFKIQEVMKGQWHTSFFTLIIFYGTGQSRNTQTEGLACVSDYVTDISCVWWNSTFSSDQRCVLGGKCDIKRCVSRSCELLPLSNQSPSRRSCSLSFDKHHFFFVNKFWLNVTCNGSVVTKIHYQPSRHIKTQPPDMPTVSEDRITWSKGSNFPEAIKSYEFQLQVKALHTSWETATLRNCSQENDVQLDHNKLTVGEVYQARVRVKPVEPLDHGYFRGEWSDWSPTVSWRSEIGKPPMKPRYDVSPSVPDDIRIVLIIGSLILLVLTSLCLVICKLKKSKRSIKPNNQHVPDPSKYFQPLHTVHGGNFRKWLGCQNSVGPFLTLQSCDDISPVEVSNFWDVSLMDPAAQMSAAVFNQVDSGLENSGTSHASSSVFSNMGYFYSKSNRGSLYLESCPVYFSYHPEEATSSTASSPGSSYDCLQTPSYQTDQPVSPDSGFGMAGEELCEDEQEDEDWRDAETCAVEGQALISFIMSLSQGSHSAVRRPESLSPVAVSTPLSEPARASGGASGSEPAEAAVVRASSMIEPCGSGYLTLKEMQKYSNKSI
ncbi:interleukin-2 receptor subunit beta isoform X2 [Puntigrus tetrazona]|uniref:interleukin-2 receptor subunit beta isoform X2 n=1 Tax=Puntigrus tetrazona TaxID=1606681 RepID=UPI001C8A7BDE|nr:interleukin-2 receptor subunit beta isoform X2 [Puntigrus tetrazona]